MIYYMHLDNNPFQEIKEGSKTVEIRLNDEKRSKLTLNDKINFINRETSENLLTGIVSLKTYKTYEELVHGTFLGAFGPRYSNKQELLEKSFAYYSKKDQLKYGLLRIGLKLV